MALIERLELFVQTRDERWGDSPNSLRLFWDGEEIAVLQPPPARGKATRMTAVPTKELDYGTFLERPVQLGLTADERWAPRAAFLVGYVADIGLRPLAQNFRSNPNSYVSQDLAEGTDRWPLRTITQARNTDPLRTLVVTTKTMDIASASSNGPFELSLFGAAGNLPCLIYQTILSMVGRQAPAEQNGWYFALLPLHAGADFTVDGVSGAQLSVRSDDAWAASRFNLYAFNEDLSSGRLLGGRWYPEGQWISQDPHDSGRQDAAALDAVAFSNE